MSMLWWWGHFLNAHTHKVPVLPGTRHVTSLTCRAVMMAARERAVKVMAALDRRIPSLGDFVGQSWSAWADWAGVMTADGKEMTRHTHQLLWSYLPKPARLLLVETAGRTNRVTQTKTLPGPSAGWLTCRCRFLSLTQIYTNIKTWSL